MGIYDDGLQPLWRYSSRENIRAGNARALDDPGSFEALPVFRAECQNHVKSLRVCVQIYRGHRIFVWCISEGATGGLVSTNLAFILLSQRANRAALFHRLMGLAIRQRSTFCVLLRSISIDTIKQRPRYSYPTVTFQVQIVYCHLKKSGSSRKRAVYMFTVFRNKIWSLVNISIQCFTFLRASIIFISAIRLYELFWVSRANAALTAPWRHSLRYMLYCQ